MLIYGLTIAELADAIREDPFLLCNTNLPLPVVIDADMVALLEAGIGYKTNFYMLLPPSPLNNRSNRFEIRLDQPLDPGARQVEVLARILQALASGFSETPPAFTPVTHRLFRSFIIPSLKQLPLGKKHRDDWLQQDSQGVPLLQWLEPIRQAVTGINQHIPLAATQQKCLETQLRKMDQQIEWVFDRAASTVTSRRAPGEPGIDEAL